MLVFVHNIAARAKHRQIMADIDWISWSKTRPLTIDALLIFTGNDVDPFTALVGGALCQRFKLSSHGVQNISRAFGGLQELHGHPVIGLGYTPRHVVNLLLKSDDGSCFLAICGALSEYYPPEIVTAFFMLLARRSDLPEDMAPAESQWTKLIAACAGVLATSPFGAIITKYAEVCQASISTNAAQILEWVLALNDRTSGTISGDAPFLAALAEWLFGINVAIQTEKGQNGTPNGQAQLTLKSTASELATGGRVHWDAVFRTCFGQAWRELNKESLTAVIACASGLTHESLVSSGCDPRTFFLRHEVGIPHLDGFGVNETIIAWFEELRRLAPGIPRYYKAHHGKEELAKEFNKHMQGLEAECKCSTCGDGSSGVCKVSLVEVVIGLGLYVARMVVIPNLYPKVDGIQEYYRLLHQERLNRQKKHIGYSEWFIDGLTNDLPTPFKMLEVACILFTGSRPGPMPGNQVSLSRNGVVLIITFLKFNPEDDPQTRPGASVQVQNGGFSWYGRFLQKNFWDLGPANKSMEEGFSDFRLRPKEIKQAVKLVDRVTYISLIPNVEEWKVKAEEQGWYVFK